LDPLQFVSRAKSAVLANKSRKKLGILTDSTRADRPHHQCGLSGSQTVQPQGRTIHPSFSGTQHMHPTFWRSLNEPKTTNSMCSHRFSYASCHILGWYFLRKRSFNILGKSLPCSVCNKYALPDITYVTL
jgi:hypothetical protein